MKKSDVMAAIKRLESTTQSFGYPNVSALQKVDAIVSELSASELGTNFHGKLISFQKLAEIGLSTRKFEKIPGGVAGVCNNALGDCMSMKMILEALPLHD